MKLRRLCTFAALVLIAAASSPTLDAQARVTMSRISVEKDFTTPWAAVETMLRAAKVEDLETLALCFDRRTERAFVPYRDGTATTQQLDALSEWAWNAHVVDVEMDGIHDAIVNVAFPPEDRPFSMKLTRTSDGWKIGAR